jgi:phenylacetate-CoA ligase
MERKPTEHWNSSIEMISRDTLRDLQSERLVRQVHHVYHHSAFFKEFYDAAGVRPSDIASIDDITKLPVMGKDDLRRFRASSGDPFCGTLCVPVSALKKVHKSTGTSGAPNVFGITEGDWDQSTENFARMLYRVGLRDGHRTNNWLEAAMTWHGYSMTAWGARKVGATVFTLEFDNRSVVQTNLELLAGADLNAIFIYHPEIEVKYLRQEGLIPTEIHPNLSFIYSAFLCTAARRKILEDAWGVPYWNMGASGDQYIPASECHLSAPALHYPEDQFIVETVDSETLQPVEPGAEGELVLTNLWAEATPFLRYRMEDVVTVDDSPCGCGSTHARVNYRGRYAWSVAVGERRIFSDDVENILWAHPKTEFSAYQLVKESSRTQGRLRVRSTVQGEAEPGLAELLTEQLERELEVPVEIVFVEPETIAVGTVKFVRVTTQE